MRLFTGTTAGVLADGAVGILFRVSVVAVQVNFHRSALAVNHDMECVSLCQDVGFVSVIQYVVTADVGSQFGCCFIYAFLTFLQFDVSLYCGGQFLRSSFGSQCRPEKWCMSSRFSPLHSVSHRSWH